MAAYGNYISRFKIETDNKYLFILFMDEEGQWCAEEDVTVWDEDLVEQMGRAIEQHDMA